MPDLRAYVANCLVQGDSITQRGNSWIRDTIELNCGNQTYILKQKEEVINGNLSSIKGSFYATTEILVKNVSLSTKDQTLEEIKRICWLLSFAGLSRTICYGHHYPDGSKEGFFQRVIETPANYFRPTIDIQDGKQVKAFIEQTYDNFCYFEHSRKLPVAIDYLLQAERQNQPTECKLIFAFVLLENLKDTYAKDKKIPYLNGYFRKQSGKNSPRYGFEELLNLMFREVKMRRGLKKIVRLRNEIIHSGLSQKAHHQSWTLYERIHDLIREYLIRLLGYQGNYYIYSNPNGLPKKIGK